MTLYTHIESVLGSVLLTSRANKLTGLYFADQPHAPRIARDWIEQEDAAIFVQTQQQLEEFASGKREKFNLPLDLRGTPFQVLVWKEIHKIPFGGTLTYAELARRVGSPQAIRAAGTATGANPISWIIPCHRVIGKNGALTGYAGGLPRKKALLEFEAAVSSGKEVLLALGSRQPEMALA